MSKATRQSAHVTNTAALQVNKFQEKSNPSQDSSSEDDDVVIQSQPSSSQTQVMHSMYIPYVEGTTMDWTMNESLYHRFPKWKIKCENILDCELVLLSEVRKCNKIVAWSGDFGIDQYVSWYLSPEDLCLEVIWTKCEE